MKITKVVLCILLHTLFVLTSIAQTRYDVKVVDAETKEALPSVNIRLNGKNCALTNFEGEFKITALPKDTIQLRMVGYKTVSMYASEMPKIIRMTTATYQMSQVTVLGNEALVQQIAKATAKAYNKRKRERSQFFYRQTMLLGEKQDVLEAIVDARSALNLRDMHFVAGRHGMETENQWTDSNISNMNLHHILELAPMMKDAIFWDDTTIPLSESRSIKKYQKTYSIKVKELSDRGKSIYKINFERPVTMKNEKRMMTGTLYVEKSTLRLLSFDGQAERMMLYVSKQQSSNNNAYIPLTLRLHIDYEYKHGYPEIANLSMQTESGNFHARTMLFNMGRQDKRIRGSSMDEKDNLHKTIQRVGYDSTFWAKDEIIKRTEEERKIIEGVATERHVDKTPTVNTPQDSLTALERLKERVRLFGERIPQEKVFVQMDNTCYFLGDTIWFSAFTSRTNSDRPSKISRVLYAELWNHDGYLVERKLVEMHDGRGSGFFELPDTLYSGYFELRAYTRWQLNWGQTEHPHNKFSEDWFYNKQMAKEYFQDYEKLYSRVFPVYDNPKTKGEYMRDMTLRPLRRYFKKDEKPQKLLLSLFPEGGNAVQGLPCRMAFEAAMEDGEVKDGTLAVLMKGDTIKIKNNNGENVVEVKTENRGRGSFTFTPETGKTYVAEFTADDGTNVKQEIKNIEREGVSLSVTPQGDEWQIDVRRNIDRPLAMTIMHEGVVQHFFELTNNTYRVKDVQLPAGIQQVTVFDEEGRVWADRLFFVTKPELTEPTLRISGLKDQYEPFEEISFDVKTDISSVLPHHISLSVRDAAQQDVTFDSGNIMTEMLLSSELKGFIPEPDWFFEQDDEQHHRALDLLMMTQGWRRFSWRDMALPGWSITHPAEQSPMVTGTVNQYLIDLNEQFPTPPTYIGRMNETEFPSNPSISNNLKFQRDKFNGIGNMKKEVKVHTEFVKPDAPKGRKAAMVTECTTKDGAFNLTLPNFYGDCVMFVTAKDTTLWNKRLEKRYANKPERSGLKTWIQLESEADARTIDYAEFYVRLNFPHPRWIKPYTFYQTHPAAPKYGFDKSILTTDKTRLLDEITIRGRHNGMRNIDLNKPVCVMDAYEAANAAMDAGFITDLYALKEYPGEFMYEETISQDSSIMVIPKMSKSLRGFGYGNTGEIATGIILNTIGDMNMYRRYDRALFWDDKRVAGNGIQTGAFFSPEEQLRYSRLEYIDKVYLYSDYSPRNEGSERYRQDDQPTVEISLHKYPDNSRRVTYRDRRYILHGFAYQGDFYHPNYQRNPPTEGQKDYRRTLYWNPNLRLDSDGGAHVTLFNNSKTTQVHVDANGISNGGKLLYCK